VIRHREIKAEQGEDGTDQSLGLAQRQVKHGTECQGSGNRQAGVAGLTASTGAWLSLSGLHRLGRKPHTVRLPRARRLASRCPVGDPVSLLRNVMPAVAIGFERHGRRPLRSRARPPISVPEAVHPDDPCNNVASESKTATVRKPRR
jgi:hypothetical protein